MKQGSGVRDDETGVGDQGSGVEKYRPVRLAISIEKGWE